MSDMFRSWPWIITLLLLVLTLGYFWVLSHDLTFKRVEAEKPAAVKVK